MAEDQTPQGPRCRDCQWFLAIKAVQFSEEKTPLGVRQVKNEHEEYYCRCSGSWGNGTNETDPDWPACPGASLYVASPDDKNSPT